MTIFELGALGEFAGAMLLFASIIYVGIQIRQNTAATKGQMYQARLDSIQQAQLTIAASSELSAIMMKTTSEGELDLSKLSELTPIEREQLRNVQQCNKLRCDNLFYQYKMGLIDKEFHQEVTEAIVRSFAPLWNALGFGFVRGSFQKEIDRIVGRSE